jgi:hypothetical protein
MNCPEALRELDTDWLKASVDHAEFPLAERVLRAAADE